MESNSDYVPADPDQIPVFANAPLKKAPDPGFSGKLIVAVHGMGDQTRNDFAQTVARLFARYFALKHKQVTQTRLLPLGAWDGGRETDVDDPAVCFEPVPMCAGLKDYAFAEFHWADIARTLEDDGHRLEEATHWARSVVERLGQRHGPSTGLGPEQFHLAGYVIEEIAETLALIQKVAMAGQLFKLSKKDVDTVLTQYLCDVQQVGDYQRQREKIRDRFFNRMEWLHRTYPNAEIHLVAHSEGTAVTLFGLLTALCQAGRNEVAEMRKPKASPQAGPSTEYDLSRLDPSQKVPKMPNWAWLEKLRSFSTMGSPIDKHLHLWPEMWRTFEKNAGWLPLAQVIRWRNYYDYADPVGYELDSAQFKLAEWGCEAFDFNVTKHDHGYRRYPLPGQAHLDYFTDDDLFAHIIEDAVEAQENPVAPPQTIWRGRLSPVVPFAIVLGLWFAAVFVLHRGLTPEKSLQELCCHGAKAASATPEALGELGKDTYGLLGCWALLVGTTMLARILRLSRSPRVFALFGGLFALGAAVFWFQPGTFSLEAGFRVGAWTFNLQVASPLLEMVSKAFFIVWSLVPVAIAWYVDFLACQKRWRPVWGLRILIVAGTAMLGGMLVVPRLAAGTNSASALLGGLAGFAVLWWLGALLFDLAFCWQRYINTPGDSWMDRLWKGREAKARRAVAQKTAPPAPPATA